MFGVGEMAGGEVSGVQHLVEAAVLGGLLWLAGRRQRAAGLVLLTLSVPLGLALVIVIVSIVHGEPLVLLVVLPSIRTGALLLLASRSGSAPRRIHVRSGHV